MFVCASASTYICGYRGVHAGVCKFTCIYRCYVCRQILTYLLAPGSQPGFRTCRCVGLPQLLRPAALGIPFVFLCRNGDVAFLSFVRICLLFCPFVHLYLMVCIFCFFVLHLLVPVVGLSTLSYGRLRRCVAFSFPFSPVCFSSFLLCSQSLYLSSLFDASGVRSSLFWGVRAKLVGREGVGVSRVQHFGSFGQQHGGPHRLQSP